MLFIANLQSMTVPCLSVCLSDIYDSIFQILHDTISRYNVFMGNIQSVSNSLNHKDKRAGIGLVKLAIHATERNIFCLNISHSVTYNVA